MALPSRKKKGTEASKEAVPLYEIFGGILESFCLGIWKGKELAEMYDKNPGK